MHTKFEYDNYGNCIQYCKTPFSSTEIEWERGNLLKKIRNTEYEYNSSGVRFRKKTGSETTEYYYDGTKLLGESRNGEKEIRYIYDAEGIAGFEISSEANPYMFVKDARNNVVAILDNGGEVAAYEYDAWGSCKVVKDTDGIGTLNPIRWKSQYYDSDSGFYYINNRFYSATTKQFLDGGSPETALANATTIYGLNPHNSTLTNPLSEVYNEYTIETETELVYDAPKLNKWQYFWNVSWKRFWGSKLGKLLSLVIFIAATILAIFCPAFTPYYISAVLGTTVSLVIGATIAGFRNKESFVDGFNNYINEEWAPAFAISFTLAMVSFGVSIATQAIQNAIPKTYKFKSKFELEKHFLKHNEDFNYMFKNSKEYLDAANDVIKNGTKVSYLYNNKVTYGYVQFYANSTRNGMAKFAFVGMNNSRIATFHVKNAKELWRLLGRIGI